MSGEMRRVSPQDIQLVQNLIERCLQLYMNQKEVVDTLLMQAKIEPGFTELVWQKLEEENREFFKAYHVRLALKDQIIEFNKLLQKQVELMQNGCPSGVVPLPPLDGSNSASLQQAPYYVTDQALASSTPRSEICNGDTATAIINGGESTHQTIQVSNSGPIRSERVDAASSILSAHSPTTLGMLQGMNGTAIKVEPCVGSANTEFSFCTDTSFLETRSGIEDAPVASFSGSDLTGQTLSETLLDVDTSQMGFLNQIPRNFSFSDLTEDFAQEILESYGKSPFLGPEANDFSDSPGKDYNDENRRLEPIREGQSYEDFGSD